MLTSFVFLSWWDAGDCSNPAYLANVCVAKAAQRQGVGRELIHCAVDLANQWSA
jgi:ribosomal protein S18 acetylase RimI-like enzyme